jgi:hypothetical protein
MNSGPILSIVTPTLGKFTDLWLARLLAVKGDVEFILVFPPDALTPAIEDRRVRIIKSPFKGEVMQRATGFLNASGCYIFALDDDDFVHPDIAGLVKDYFMKFPESMFLRLRREFVDHQDKAGIEKDWGALPSLDGKLLEVPIAPLDNRFNPLLLVWPFAQRKDHHGRHMENSNSGVWRAELVREGVSGYLESMKIIGSLRWMPSWGLDRPLSLYIQAEHFRKGAVAGHWMPEPAQERMVSVNPKLKWPRILVSSEILLVKSFPQYGYLWNLVIWGLWSIPRYWIGIAKRRLLGVKTVR